MIIITGVSSGLGRALVDSYLKDGHIVVGIGRHNKVEHPNYTFLKVDLTDQDQVKNLDLSWVSGEVTLINNAGMIGTIDRVSSLKEWDLARVMQVNTIAPMILAKRCYHLSDKDEFTLVNISSGAAKKAIPSWAAYCASKSALNMLSETFYLEERELGRSLKVYAVAPGVIDTPMQEEIRRANSDTFSAHENFVNLKKDGKLFTAEHCSVLLRKLLDKQYRGEVFYDLREL